MTMQLTARGPEDILAAVPVVLGFVPAEHSLVMLTFGGPRPFHARVDLPGVVGGELSDDDLDDLVAALLVPAVRNGVVRVYFVLYASDPRLCARVGATLVERFADAGITTLEVIRADRGHWHRALGDDPAGEGTAYDVAGHAFTARAVFEGHVTRGSRAEVAMSIATDPVQARRVALALQGTRPLDAEQVRRFVPRHLAEGVRPADAEVAALVLALQEPRVRDHAWWGLTRESAPACVEFWADVVRRTPVELAGDVAAVLAFAAWMEGNGALAWCAVDRAVEADPDNSLARVVSDLLTAAVPPDDRFTTTFEVLA